MKPFQLVDRESLKNKSEESAERRQVMLEDGIQDVDSLQSEDNFEDEEEDVVGPKYLKVVNSVAMFIQG